MKITNEAYKKNLHSNQLGIRHKSTQNFENTKQILVNLLFLGTPRF